jgi:uncharacterized protein (TIGR02246 family)
MAHPPERDEENDMTVPRDAAPRGVLDRFRQAWDAADATAFGQLFTEDATYVIWSGDVLRGRPEIEKAHRVLFARGATKMRFVVVKTRFVGADAAVVITAGGIGSGQVDCDKFQTLVMTRSDNDWMIAAFHNTAMSERSKQHYRAGTDSQS